MPAQSIERVEEKSSWPSLIKKTEKKRRGCRGCKGLKHALVASCEGRAGAYRHRHDVRRALVLDANPA